MRKLNSLKETNSIYSVTEIPEGATVLPMKLVATLKFKDSSPLRKKKARICVCGNFQRKGQHDMYYTANIEAPSIRLVLHETAQRRNWGLSSLDIETAFLNAKMPTTNSKYVVYVIPPRI